MKSVVCSVRYALAILLAVLVVIGHVFRMVANPEDPPSLFDHVLTAPFALCLIACFIIACGKPKGLADAAEKRFWSAGKWLYRCWPEFREEVNSELRHEGISPEEAQEAIDSVGEQDKSVAGSSQGDA